MANKEVLDQINALRIRRAASLHSMESSFPAATTIELLTASWLREAELLATSQKKGWQSEAKTLQSAVALLKLESIALEKRAASRPTPPREPVTGPTPSWTDPTGLDKLVADSAAEGRGELIAGDEPCLAVALDQVHSAHTWIGRRDELTGARRWRCAGRTDVVETPHGGTDDVAAYLSGETDVLRPLHPLDLLHRLGQAAGDGLEALDENVGRTLALLGTHLATESTAHQEVDATMSHVHADPVPPPPLLREAGVPADRPSRVPPNGAHLPVRTWADLAARADPATIPDHLSPSQLSTLDTCAAQGRLSRYEKNPGIPLWAGVGGSAFHSAVEEIERDVMKGDLTPAMLIHPDAIAASWNRHFQLTVAKTIAESGVPMTMWYASNRGKENYSWWLVEGGEMLRRYVTYRAVDDDGREVLVLPDGRSAIELELEFKLDNVDVPVKVILDIVWRLPDGSLEIWDHKTRADFMGSIVDTIQLGTQGHALAGLLGDMERVDGLPWGGITARYFDARKGTLTEAFDPIDKHPIEELEMRYADADDKRRNRPAVPVRSNLCKACPVAYLCPVGSKL